MVDDDRIDDLVNELSETNRNLSRLVDAIVRGQEQEAQAEVEDDVFPRDLGSVGRTQTTVDDIIEYERVRIRAANSDTIIAPRYTGERDRVDFYLEVFKSGMESLDVIENKLSDPQFDDFVRRLAVSEGANEDLVDEVNPGSDLFGIGVDMGGTLIFTPEKSHLALMRAMGSYWYVNRDNLGDANLINIVNRPWQILEVGSLDQIQNLDLEFNRNPEAMIEFSRDMEPIDVDMNLIDIIIERSDLNLPPGVREEYGL